MNDFNRKALLDIRQDYNFLDIALREYATKVNID